jgi:hypothetical protein
VKRLIRTAGQDEDSPQDWMQNEYGGGLPVAGSGRRTLKLIDVIKSAQAQLVDGKPNLVIIADFSPAATRNHFRDAMEAIDHEIADNTTYASLSAVLYESLSVFIPPDEPRYMLWLNRYARPELPDGAVRFLRDLFQPEIVGTTL